MTESSGVQWIDHFGQVVAELRERYELDKQNADPAPESASAEVAAGGKDNASVRKLQPS